MADTQPKPPRTRPPLTHVASLVFDTPLMILPEKLDTIIRVLTPRLGLTTQAMDDLKPALVHPHAAYAFFDDDEEDSGGNDSQSNSRPYRITDSGIALIPVRGVLMKKGTWLTSLCGMSAYDQVKSMVAQAVDDSNVRAILLDIDSPGGTTHGCFELSDYLYSVRGKATGKPMWSIANDLAASAAYAIASATDRVFVTRTGGVGSVGVFALHYEQTGADEQAGMTYTYVYAGKRKVDGNPHQPLSKEAKASIQTEVDREYDIFVNTVARNRGVKGSKIENTDAEVFYADNSLSLLADEVADIDSVVDEMTSNLTGKVVGVKVSLSSGKSGEAQDQVLESNANEKVIGEGDMAKTNLDDLNAKFDGKPVAAADVTELAGKSAGKDCPPDSKKADDADNEMKGKPPASDDEEDDKKSSKASKKTDENDDDEDDMKKASRSLAIIDLCSLAGTPQLASRYIDRGFSVSEVRRHLLDKRATKPEDTTNTATDQFTGAGVGKIVKLAQSAGVNFGGKRYKSPGEAAKAAAEFEAILSANAESYEAASEERTLVCSVPTGSNIRRYKSAALPLMAAAGLNTTGDSR